MFELSLRRDVVAGRYHGQSRNRGAGDGSTGDRRVEGELAPTTQLASVSRTIWLESLGASAPISSREVPLALADTLNEPALDNALWTLRSATDWEVFIEIGPKQIRAEFGADLQVAVLFETTEDWHRVRAKL